MNTYCVEWIFIGFEALLFGSMAFMLIRLGSIMKEGFFEKKNKDEKCQGILHNVRSLLI